MTTYTAGIAGASGYGGLELQRLLAAHPALRATVAAGALRAATTPSTPTRLARLRRRLPARCRTASRASSARRSPRPARPSSTSAPTSASAAGRTACRSCTATRCTRARAVANPGCYATATILALAPLVEAGLVDGPVAIDGKSGVSGAGKEPSAKTHLPDLHGGVTPYSVTGHRHIAEIEQASGDGRGEQRVTFTPHLLPTSRGLLVTAYVRLHRPRPPTSTRCTPSATPTSASSGSARCPRRSAWRARTSVARRRVRRRAHGHRDRRQPRSTTSSRAPPARPSRTRT